MALLPCSCIQSGTGVGDVHIVVTLPSLMPAQDAEVTVVSTVVAVSVLHLVSDQCSLLDDIFFWHNAAQSLTTSVTSSCQQYRQAGTNDNFSTGY